jgi:hypothetical protein
MGRRLSEICEKCVIYEVKSDDPPKIEKHQLNHRFLTVWLAQVSGGNV